jgi:hypothetical protein
VEDGQVALVTSTVMWRDGFRESQLVWIDPGDGSILSEDRWDGHTYQPPFDVVLWHRPTNTMLDTVNGLEIWAHCEPLKWAELSQVHICDHDAGPEMWIEAVDAVTGSTVWRHPVAVEYWTVASTGDTIYLAGAPDEITSGPGHLPSNSPIVALDLATGAEQWRSSFPEGKLYTDIVSDIIYVTHRASQ